MTLVTFEGAGPFALPSVQSASAVARGDTVEVTLSVLVEGQLTTIQTTLVPTVADALATQLLAATAKALGNKRRGE